MFAASLTLVLEDGEARNGEVHEWLELRSLEGSSKQSIQLLAHIIIMQVAALLLDGPGWFASLYMGEGREKENGLYIRAKRISFLIK